MRSTTDRAAEDQRSETAAPSSCPCSAQARPRSRRSSSAVSL